MSQESEASSCHRGPQTSPSVKHSSRLPIFLRDKCAQRDYVLGMDALRDLEPGIVLTREGELWALRAPGLDEPRRGLTPWGLARAARVRHPAQRYAPITAVATVVRGCLAER